MIFLAEFDVMRMDWGLLVWATVFFLLFWGLIGKFAFKPIVNALAKREDDIQEALDSAKAAREEMSNLKAANEDLLAEARAERIKILNEAKEIKDKTIQEAKEQAKVEASKIITGAQAEIENQKKAALKDVKNQVGQMALEVAEQVIRKELASDQTQQNLVKSLVDDMNLS